MPFLRLKSEIKDQVGKNGLTYDEILSICREIVQTDKIFVQVRGANEITFQKNVAKPSRQDENRQRAQRYPIPYLLRIARGKDHPINHHNNNQYEDVPGLQGREIVAVAIIVDKKGSPLKTYTEHEDIPKEEIENAGHIYLSRVPIPKQTPNLDNFDDYQSLAQLFDELDGNKYIRLCQTMDSALSVLHTSDLRTAISFLKIERYKERREEVKKTLMEFVIRELRLCPVQIEYETNESLV